MLKTAVLGFWLSAVPVWMQVVNVAPSWTAPAKPFKVVENIHYVGTQDLASYLIVTPAGHIIVDSGMEANADLIVSSIRTLGFDIADVKYLLTTQAHFDHVAAHARLKELSKAAVVAAEGDAPILEGGGKGDYHFGPRFHFPPVRVDRIVRDGDTVSLGGVVLTARLTPGHTKGTTTWTMTLGGGQQERLVVFVGSTTVNEGVKLLENAAYPTIAADFQRSFKVLGSLKPDVFLAAHASAAGGVAKLGSFGRAEYASYLARSRRMFEEELARQRGAR